MKHIRLTIFVTILLGLGILVLIGKFFSLSYPSIKANITSTSASNAKSSVILNNNDLNPSTIDQQIDLLDSDISALGSTGASVDNISSQ